jgi:hypothetical protein
MSLNDRARPFSMIFAVILSAVLFVRFSFWLLSAIDWKWIFMGAAFFLLHGIGAFLGELPSRKRHTQTTAEPD